MEPKFVPHCQMNLLTDWQKMMLRKYSSNTNTYWFVSYLIGTRYWYLFYVPNDCFMCIFFVLKYCREKYDAEYSHLNSCFRVLPQVWRCSQQSILGAIKSWWMRNLLASSPPLLLAALSDARRAKVARSSPVVLYNPVLLRTNFTCSTVKTENTKSCLEYCFE